VVRNIKAERLDESSVPLAYFPLAQQPHWYLDRLHLLVRTTSEAEASLAAIGRTLRTVDADVPVENLTTFATVVSGVLLPQRLVAQVLGAFGVLAIIVAIVGMYGVVAYLVSRRAREIGIRIALGAQRPAVIGLVIGHNIRLVALGVAIGSLMAALLAPTTASLLYGVSTTDVWTYGATGLLLLGVGLAAAYVPARRAASIAPAEVLRPE